MPSNEMNNVLNIVSVNLDLKEFLELMKGQGVKLYQAWNINVHAFYFEIEDKTIEEIIEVLKKETYPCMDLLACSDPDEVPIANFTVIDENTVRARINSDLIEMEAPAVEKTSEKNITLTYSAKSISASDLAICLHGIVPVDYNVHYLSLGKEFQITPLPKTFKEAVEYLYNFPPKAEPTYTVKGAVKDVFFWRDTDGTFYSIDSNDRMGFIPSNPGIYNG